MTSDILQHLLISPDVVQSRSLKNTRLARAPNDLEAKPKTVSARCDLSALKAQKQTDFCLRRISHISRTSADRKRKKKTNIQTYIYIFFRNLKTPAAEDKTQSLNPKPHMDELRNGKRGKNRLYC